MVGHLSLNHIYFSYHQTVLVHINSVHTCMRSIKQVENGPALNEHRYESELNKNVMAQQKFFTTGRKKGRNLLELI